MSNQELTKKLLTLKKTPELAIFDELRELNNLLNQIKEKPHPPLEIPPYPETKDIDLTEVEGLLESVIGGLREIKDEMSKPVEIELDIQ